MKTYEEQNIDTSQRDIFAELKEHKLT